MLPILVIVAQAQGAVMHAGDSQALLDPMRPVTRITRTSFTLQYFTAEPAETKIEIRRDDLPRVAFKHKVRGSARIASNGKTGTWHELTVSGLEPGRRYYYRVWDPGAKPTAQEQNWGAGEGWRREYAVSTLAPRGQKTIIRLPVKVLLMPNVINIESAYASGAGQASLPPKVTSEQIQKIKDEFAVSSRFFWVNSGMRLWVDFQFFVDERWQRWGPEPRNAAKFYKGWPASRSWAGKDYEGPGGGDFTVLDTKNPLKPGKDPVYEELPYSHQVEMAWPRRWNASKKAWEFYNSGGGTYGVDSFPQGFSGRSQFLGGGDTAWLATHETHHSLESHGQFSLSNREDDRIVFNHYAARRRTALPSGQYDEVDWSTSGRHGEHWDGMAFWDRTLTDAQWLRMYFGYTTTVRDADGDGFPDADARLPLDERRFGSSTSTPTTDGMTPDLQKVMLSTWVPGPLQTSWIKPPFQAIKPDPRKADSDGDSEPDLIDPYPLYPYKPFIYPFAAKVDGELSEWRAIPMSGLMNKGGIRLAFKQGQDAAGYYGMLRIKGNWKRVQIAQDGEGLGIYSGQGVQGLDLRNENDYSVRPYIGPTTPRWKATRRGDTTDFEWSWPNRGDGMWFWTRGGREIGTVITVVDPDERAYSVYEPYRPFYARMLEPAGRAPLPSEAPASLGTGEGVALRPGDDKVKLGSGWKAAGDSWRYSGQEESPLWLSLTQSELDTAPTKGRDFDLQVTIEAKADAVLGAFAKGQREMNAGKDYIGFVGGYGNAVSRLRLFGREEGDEPVVMTPGVHRVQLSRTDGSVWLIFDGRPILWARDPSPKTTIERLAVIGGYGAAQVVREIRYRLR